MNEPIIIDAVRTAYGKRRGAFREIRPDSLLAEAVKAVIGKNGISPAHVEDVIVGCVSQAGEQSANVGRLAALIAGLPSTVPGVSLNRMCGSSQQAVHFGAQAVASGDLRYVVAGGVESMSRVPMFLDVTLGQREFRGFDDLNPELLRLYPLVHQLESAERIATKWGITRDDADSFAKESHRRAHAAAIAGVHSEIVPIQGLDAEGNPVQLATDEGIRSSIDEKKMASMAPALRPPGEGIVTAANASQMSDGASAVLIGDKASAIADGLPVRAKFLSRVAVGSDPVMQLTGVIPATEKAVARAGLTLSDIDWIEINEAFASVVIAWLREFSKVAPNLEEKVNPWGGAIAHGHPLGASGGGLLAKTLSGLRSTGGTFGLQLMCIGHGMATATVVERLL